MAEISGTPDSTGAGGTPVSARISGAITGLGFNKTIIRNWSRWWILMWAMFTPVVIVSAFHLEFWPWVAVALALFFVPEMISLRNQDDPYPPLTSTIRRFVPNWVAFPAIYFCLGSIGANWLEAPQPFYVGLLAGLLGWLNDHFTVTYARPGEPMVAAQLPPQQPIPA